MFVESGSSEFDIDNHYILSLLRKKSYDIFIALKP